MRDDAHSNSLPETAPVFPLPNVVFFPRTVLPLHVFEPRYREMVETAVGAEGCIAMSLLRPGWTADYEGSPAYHDVGCLGRMTDVSRTEDGRYYLKLIGLRKVALGDVVQAAPYRTARIRPIEETVPADVDPESRGDLVRLLGTCGVLLQELSDRPFPMVSVTEDLPYEAAVNWLCFQMNLPSDEKQALLEENDLRERCRRLTRLMESHLNTILLSRGPEAEEDDSTPVN